MSFDQFEFVKVHNTGDTLLRFPIPKAAGDNRPGIRFAEIEPGAHQIMPFLSAVAAFGHPGERDLSPKQRNRAEQYRRLRLQWGFAEGFDVETEAERVVHRFPDETGSWEAKMPDFAVTTLDDQRIYMLIEDPQGTKPQPNGDGGVISSDLAPNASTDALLALVTKLTSQVAEMQQQLIAQGEGAHSPAEEQPEIPRPPDQEPPVGEDTPSASPVARQPSTDTSDAPRRSKVAAGVS